MPSLCDRQLTHACVSRIAAVDSEPFDMETFLSSPNVEAEDEEEAPAAGNSRSPATCAVCGEEFNERRNIKAHMESVHAEDRPKLACLLCLGCFNVRKAFYHQKDLRRHLRSKTHLNNKNSEVSSDMWMEVHEMWEKEVY